jgi:hypothetical protein
MLLARDTRRWLLPSFPLTQQGRAQTLRGQPTSLPLDSLQKH